MKNEPGSKRKEGVEGRIRRRSGAAVASRRVFGYLAGATAIIGIGAGILVTIIDRQDFPTVGDGIWWAIVTLARWATATSCRTPPGDAWWARW